MTVHVTIPLDDADKRELDQIAQASNMSVERLMAGMVRERLEREKWLRAEIQKGADSAQAEPLIDHEDVFAALDERMRARSRSR